MTQVRTIKCFSPLSIDHDFEQFLNRRACEADRAVIKVPLSHLLLCRGNVLDPLRERILILRFGVKPRLIKYLAGVVKNAAHESSDEFAGNAISEATCENRLTVILIVGQTFQQTFADQISWVAFLSTETTPDFGNQQADIVIHLKLGPDKAGGRRKSLQSRKDVTYQSIVQVDGGGQHVEGPLGEGPFAAKACCGWAFTRHGADEVHEKLGERLEVQRTVDTKAFDARRLVWRIVASTEQYRIHRFHHRLIGRDGVKQSHAHLADVVFGGLGQIGPLLKVTRILGNTLAQQSGVRRTDDIVGIALRHADQETFHRWSKLVEVDGKFHHVIDLIAIQRLEIRQKVFGLREVGFSLLVHTPIDRFIWSLKKAILTVSDILVAAIIGKLAPVNFGSGNYGGNTDVIFGLELLSRVKVLPQFKGSPRVIAK